MKNNSGLETFVLYSSFKVYVHNYFWNVHFIKEQFFSQSLYAIIVSE